MILSDLVSARPARRMHRIAAGGLVSLMSLALLASSAVPVFGQEPAAGAAKDGAAPADAVDQTKPKKGKATAPPQQEASAFKLPADAMRPPPSSAHVGTTPMDQIDLGVPEPAPPEPGRKPEFFKDTKFSGQIRSFYLYRDKYDDSLSEAEAIGGSVSYLSGYAGGHFRIGAVGYASLPVYAPEDHDGTLLLKPGQEGYAVLGQAYAEIKFVEGVAMAFGRKEYNTPYLNKNDSRMTPNTFEAISLSGKRGGKDGAPEWRFGGGYVSQIKERNSDEFVPMSEDAGATVDRGVYVAGFNFKNKGLSIGAFDYFSDDIINIFYTEFMYEWSLAENRKLKLSAQYSDQGSTGDDLLTGTEFSTSQWGLKTDLTLGAALLTVAWTDTDSGAGMRNPWSGHPGYTSVQLQDFYRASESALMLRGSYDFTKHGVKGLSTYALWVHGSGVEAPAYNEDEYDFNLQWTADAKSKMRGFSLRLRYAHVDQDGGGDPSIDDFRLILNYDLPRKKL